MKTQPQSNKISQACRTTSKPQELWGFFSFRKPDRLVFLIALVLPIAGCFEQAISIAWPDAAPADPDFSAHWRGDINSDSAWRYKLERRIKGQFLEKGFVQVAHTADPNVIAFGIMGIKTDDEEYSWIERRFFAYTEAKAQKPKKPIDHDRIGGHVQYNLIYRRVFWFFLWSETDPDKIPALIEHYYKEYLKVL